MPKWSYRRVNRRNSSKIFTSTAKAPPVQMAEKAEGAVAVTNADEHMKKICISVGLLLSLLRAGQAQSLDKPAYESRKLKVEEINLVSSYYHQDGNNSAVTGGIGTETTH